MSTPVITLGPFLDHYGPIRYPHTYIKVGGKKMAYVNDYGQVFRTSARADRYMIEIEAFVAEMVAVGTLVLKKERP